MKKLFSLFVAAGILAFMACGGGTDKAKEQKIKDSLKKDSIAKVEKKAFTEDSLKKAEEAAKDTLKKDPKNQGNNQNNQQKPPVDKPPVGKG